MPIAQWNILDRAPDDWGAMLADALVRRNVDMACLQEVPVDGLDALTAWSAGRRPRPAAVKNAAAGRISAAERRSGYFSFFGPHTPEPQPRWKAPWSVDDDEPGGFPSLRPISRPFIDLSVP